MHLDSVGACCGKRRGLAAILLPPSDLRRMSYFALEDGEKDPHELAASRCIKVATCICGAPRLALSDLCSELIRTRSLAPVHRFDRRNSTECNPHRSPGRGTGCPLGFTAWLCRSQASSEVSPSTWSSRIPWNNPAKSSRNGYLLCAVTASVMIVGGVIVWIIQRRAMNAYIEPWRSKHDESSAALKKERESICQERLHRVVGMKHSSAHSCLGAAVKRICREKAKLA